MEAVSGSDYKMVSRTFPLNFPAWDASFFPK